jgi:hypothetical protein
MNQAHRPRRTTRSADWLCWIVTSQARCHFGQIARSSGRFDPRAALSGVDLIPSVDGTCPNDKGRTRGQLALAPGAR